MGLADNASRASQRGDQRAVSRSEMRARQQGNSVRRPPAVAPARGTSSLRGFTGPIGTGTSAPTRSSGGGNNDLTPWRDSKNWAGEPGFSRYTGPRPDALSYPGIQGKGEEAMVMRRDYSLIADRNQPYKAYPRYSERDVQALRGMPPPKVAELQEELASKGLLYGEWTYGMLDQNTIKAYENLLGMANNADWTSREVLDYLGQVGGFGGANDRGGQYGGGGGGRRRGRRGGGGGGGAGLVVNLSNPKDLRKLAEEVAFQRTGTRANNFDPDAFVSAYQAAEKAAQEKAYAAAQAGAGTVEQVRDPQGLAEEMVTEAEGGKVAARSALDKAGVFLRMLDGGF